MRPTPHRVAAVVAILALTFGVRTGSALLPPVGAAGPASWSGDLTPIAPSDWNADRAAHLLERAGFGAAPEEVARFAALTPQQAVNQLVDYETVPTSARSTGSAAAARSRAR